MAENTKALILQLRPKLHELQDEETYTEQEVKSILFGFARDLDCDWPDEQLREFIDMVFED